MEYRAYTGLGAGQSFPGWLSIVGVLRPDSGTSSGLVRFQVLDLGFAVKSGSDCSFPGPFTLYILGSQSGHLDEESSSKLCSLSVSIGSSS